MTKDQLLQGEKLKVVLDRMEKTIERVETLRLSWEGTGAVYFFNKSELGNIPELVEIFQNVTDTAQALLQKQLEKQHKKFTDEFKNL